MGQVVSNPNGGSSAPHSTSPSPTPSMNLNFNKKFEEEELNKLISIFRDLASESPGWTIDKETFRRQFSFLTDDLGDRLFDAFDVSGDGLVSCEEFLCGLALCSRGTVDERLKFCFSVFDEKNDGGISKEEMFNLLLKTSRSVNKFQQASEVLDDDESHPMAKENDATEVAMQQEMESKIEKMVEVAFKNYEVDGDGKLSFEEFKQWALQTPEASRFIRYLLQNASIFRSTVPLSSIRGHTPAPPGNHHIRGNMDSGVLKEGEKVLVHGFKVSLIMPTGETIRGSLYATNWKLFFLSGIQHVDMLTRVPWSMITSTKMHRAMSGDGVFLAVECCDFRTLAFAFSDIARLAVVIKIVSRHISPENPEEAFAFHNKENRGQWNGYSVYSPQKEYERMGLPNEQWRFTHINDNYQVCASYPQSFVVPASMTDEEVTQAASFRSKGRLPVLVWKHPNYDAAIARSSQPNVGVMRKRNRNDEKLLKAINAANALNGSLFIVDCRPYVNAAGSASKGGGVENSNNYSNELYFERCRVEFMGMGNIYAVQKSYRKLFELCTQPNRDSGSWLSRFEGTGWPNHVFTMLRTAMNIVESVAKNGESVLVHCTDGWDRTTQVVSLATLLMDPYYRTIRGLQVLIEKDWLSFGYNFASRNGYDSKSRKLSPIFMMWMDGLWQILRQFPTAFEYNEKLLIYILDHSYSCRFGTFLFNSDRERKNYNILERTPSLWARVDARLEDFRNPLYRSPARQIGEDREEQVMVLVPKCDIRYYQFWTKYYLRWIDSLEEIPTDAPPTVEEQFEALKVHCAELEKQLENRDLASAKCIASDVLNEVLSKVVTTANTTPARRSVTMPTIPLDGYWESKNTLESESGESASSRSSQHLGRTPPLQRLLTLKHNLNDHVYRHSISYDPPQWVPDSMGPSCAKCKLAFNLMRRRHHCRHCGQIFCNPCSTWKIRLPMFNYFDPVRVCEDCYSRVSQLIASGNESGNRSSYPYY